MKRITFREGETRYTDEAIVSPLRLCLLDGELPRGMFARMIIHEYADSERGIEVRTVRQARDPGGRRYCTFWGEDAVANAQKSLVRWAARILRERKA